MQLCRDLLDEARFLGHCIDAADIDQRFTDRYDNTGKAAATADIEQAYGLATGMAAQGRQQAQAVDEMLGQHRLRFTYRGQVIDLVPFRDQGQVVQQQIELGVAQPQRQFLGRSRQRQAQRIRCLTQVALAIDWLEASPPKPLKRPRFRCTSNREIAAGVTPEIRDAWPRVSGLCLFSFCLASKERAVTRP